MSAPFKFAHLSDTHVRPDAPGQSRVFTDHLGQIEAGDYAFVIHTGDLMEEPSAWAARAFHTMASMLSIPIFLVPGNHDVYNPHMGGIEAPWWADLAVDSGLQTQFRTWFGPNWYAFSYQGVSFVAFDSLIVNSGLPEEEAQWDWLEGTLPDLAARRPDHLVLFTHLPLFIHEPCEQLDPTDFRNRYLVLAPPGRDRLLCLVRRHRVDAVLTGHAHAPWEMSHTWPEGFTTRFVTTGSSGMVSPMAIDHFNLPLDPAHGLGFHEHRIGGEGVSSSYRQYRPPVRSAPWQLGQAWRRYCPEGQGPTPQGGAGWHDVEYHPAAPEWQLSRPAFTLPLSEQDGLPLFMRQTFVAEATTAPFYLELCTGRAAEVYLNGTLLYELAPLEHRPPVWQSAGRTWHIDGPAISLAVNQRLVRKGENVLALRVAGQGPPSPASDGGDYVAFRRAENAQSQTGPAPEADT
jgi:predicted MPP superfamily phosphohydrolase